MKVTGPVPFTPTESAEIIETVHVLFPEECFISQHQVFDMAHEVLVEAAVRDHEREHGLLDRDSEVGQYFLDSIRSANPRPTELMAAKEILSVAGVMTFARV